jgi:hypothetical protein
MAEFNDLKTTVRDQICAHRKNYEQTKHREGVLSLGP